MGERRLTLKFASGTQKVDILEHWRVKGIEDGMECL